ncbi:unnamed protein product [Gongylonema pulchrum]|uniref:LysR_substrate domain-containing protein n=1 Tax=Gongylonema pulchrum TaxID=637853 RepID=A0A183CZR9_9BILA|nr:unnamed protein product [Gongylonema pulchrum]
MSTEDWKFFSICSNCLHENQYWQPALALIFKKPSYDQANSVPERVNSLENNRCAYFLEFPLTAELNADDLFSQVVRMLRNDDTNGLLLPKALFSSPAIAVKVITISATSLE